MGDENAATTNFFDMDDDDDRIPENICFKGIAIAPDKGIIALLTGNKKLLICTNEDCGGQNLYTRKRAISERKLFIEEKTTDKQDNVLKNSNKDIENTESKK